MNKVLPYKSIAIGLLFSALLGPVGLLYASFWGGLFMIALGIVVVSVKLLFPIVLVWIASCVWSVGAIESYNRKLLKELHT